MRHNEWSRLFAAAFAFAAAAYVGITPCRAAESDEEAERKVKIEVEVETDEGEEEEEGEFSDDTILDFMAEQFPAWRKELAELGRRAEEGDERAERERDEMFEHVRHLYFLSKENPKEFAVQKRIHNLEAESHHLGGKFREAQSEKAKEEIGGELKKLLSDLFDLREKQREREAEEIARELERIREMLAKRRANRERIIERRFQELTGMDEGLEW